MSNVNLLAADPGTLGVMLDTVSRLPTDKSPWSDDAFANNKILPDYKGMQCDGVGLIQGVMIHINEIILISISLVL